MLKSLSGTCGTSDPVYVVKQTAGAAKAALPQLRKCGHRAEIVGGRKLVQRKDEVVIAESLTWRLVEVTGWSRDGWRSLKLYYTRKGPKNVWMLGWKGRLGRCKDSALLFEHHPKIAAWVIETMRELAHV